MCQTTKKNSHTSTNNKKNSLQTNAGKAFLPSSLCKTAQSSQPFLEPTPVEVQNYPHYEQEQKQSSTHKGIQQIPSVCVENLSFAYSGQKPLLNNISFSLQTGVRLAVLGENGGGKSTLLRCLAGLLPYKNGTITYYGLPYTKAKARIGYLPQYPTHCAATVVTAFEMVYFGGLSSLFFPTKKQRLLYREKALHLLEFVGLIQKKDSLFTHLSGGEKQRILFARSLMNDPSILILDEPTASIDRQSRSCFYELLESYSTSITLIMSTHDILTTRSFFQQLAILHDGTFSLHTHTTITPSLLQELYGTHELCKHS